MKHAYGQRNLTPTQLKEVRGRWYELEKTRIEKLSRNEGKFSKDDAEGGFSQVVGSKQTLPRGQNDLTVTNATAKKVAKETGVSEKTVRRDAKYVQRLDKLTPQLKERIQSGQLKLTDQVMESLARLDHSQGGAARA